MYRVLSASKDTYLTNKYIQKVRSLDANVGQAGTLDLFVLSDETFVAGSTGSVTELSRILVKFDYSELSALTGSILDTSVGNFKAFVSLRDIYGGQTTPSNFTIDLFPLSKSFDEGRGHDVVAYRDIDSANWLTASLSPMVTWSQPGAGASGALGAEVDINTSGDLGSGVIPLGTSQKFARGDEDLLIDVTALVSASLAGILPNNGFRISFTADEETDLVTRFVKRFGSKDAISKDIHPKLIIKYEDYLNDPGNVVAFDVSQSLFTYNSVNGSHKNFFSGSIEIINSNSLILELAASKSISYTTNSWSPSHSASINHLTRSIEYIKRFFTGSQYEIGSLSQQGIYNAPVILSAIDDIELRTFLSGARELGFSSTWKSIDGTVKYSEGFITFKRLRGNFSNAAQQNLVVNVTNLLEEYNNTEEVRLRVFASDLNQDIPAFKVPTALKSIIIPNMQWRLRRAFSREIVIPWSEATRMSTDQGGMYFDFYMRDLGANEIYEFEFLIKDSFGRDRTITNRGFRFKVSF